MQQSAGRAGGTEVFSQQRALGPCTPGRTYVHARHCGSRAQVSRQISALGSARSNSGNRSPDDRRSLPRRAATAAVVAAAVKVRRARYRPRREAAVAVVAGCGGGGAVFTPDRQQSAGRLPGTLFFSQQRACCPWTPGLDVGERAALRFAQAPVATELRSRRLQIEAGVVRAAAIDIGLPRRARPSGRRRRIQRGRAGGGGGGWRGWRRRRGHLHARQTAIGDALPGTLCLSQQRACCPW